LFDLNLDEASRLEFEVSLLEKGLGVREYTILDFRLASVDWENVCSVSILPIYRLRFQVKLVSGIEIEDNALGG